jgi:hypothetical protein
VCEGVETVDKKKFFRLVSADVACGVGKLGSLVTQSVDLENSL